MNKFMVITDSACDLSLSQYKEFNVEYVPFYVSFNGVDYEKEHDDISPKQFYQRLKTEKGMPKTSLPSVHDYINCFTKHLKDGVDIICICLSSKFSGSFQSAINAQGILLEEYPERKIIIIDSYNATFGQGLLVVEATKMRDNGIDINTTAEILEKLKSTINITFTIDSLEFLRRGGRIGAVSAFAGALLSIKPIIQLVNGELKPYSKIRGRKKALKEIIDISMGLLNDKYDEYEFAVIQAECEEDSLEVKALLESQYGINRIGHPSYIGVTIGCHTGPSPLGVTTIKSYKNFL